MTKQEAIQQAIDRIKGQEAKPDDIVAHRSNDLAVKFLRYEGDDAVCEDVKLGEVRYPRSEIFSPKKVINVANHLLNLGFWNEGMESMMLTLK